MASTPATDTALDRALLELESLGLARPTNVLFAEYLLALSGEGLIDASAAVEISATYNRARYASGSAEDDQSRSAAAAIEQVTARLKALPEAERTELVQKVVRRLALHTDKAAGEKNEATGAPSSPAAAPAAASSRPAASTVPTRAQDAGNSAAGAAPGAAATKSRQPRWSRPWATVEAFGICCLAMFFCGYFFREVSQVAIAKTAGNERRRDVWVSPETWVETISDRGKDELGAQHFRTARLALELALACSDDETSDKHADTMNALAWSYLFPDTDGVKDVPRAMSLVTKSLAIRREATYLDTAAEAHYQLGNPAEAVRLEKEALVRARGARRTQLVLEFERQLRKFESAQRCFPVRAEH